MTSTPEMPESVRDVIDRAKALGSLEGFALESWLGLVAATSFDAGRQTVSERAVTCIYEARSRTGLHSAAAESWCRTHGWDCPNAAPQAPETEPAANHSGRSSAVAAPDSERVESLGQPFTLAEFVRESNRIEGIHRAPTDEELVATQYFLDLDVLTISDVVKLVDVYQRGARPRFVQGLDVRVGGHVPPRGGPHVQSALQRILEAVNDGDFSAYEAHVAYETLHPFTDGNGRSGRAIWLWATGGMEQAPLGFLHHFYYESLQGARK